MKKTSLDEEFYKKRSINDLILFSIFTLTEKKEKCTFENLVKTCFTLFPKRFALSNHPKWPDSRKPDRPLRTLRKEKLITGSPSTTFSLTKAGRKKALEIAKSFQQKQLL